MFEMNVRLADHTKRYSIHAAAPSGWEVRLEEDHEVRRNDVYMDWHRVERARLLFEREVSQLTERGWLLL